MKQEKTQPTNPLSNHAVRDSKPCTMGRPKIAAPATRRRLQGTLARRQEGLTLSQPLFHTAVQDDNFCDQ